MSQQSKATNNQVWLHLDSRFDFRIFTYLVSFSYILIRARGGFGAQEPWCACVRRSQHFGAQKLFWFAICAPKPPLIQSHPTFHFQRTSRTFLTFLKQTLKARYTFIYFVGIDILYRYSIYISTYIVYRCSIIQIIIYYFYYYFYSNTHICTQTHFIRFTTIFSLRAGRKRSRYHESLDVEDAQNIKQALQIYIHGKENDAGGFPYRSACTKQPRYAPGCLYPSRWLPWLRRCAQRTQVYLKLMIIRVNLQFLYRRPNQYKRKLSEWDIITLFIYLCQC
ncbi:Hypothetical_protein [Hexamita inflata]|uniref:Hypothetical_protein n=1 Tax=Hexamita inflata TaxID=28002 RepID=A0AA86R3M9_9EUKA|nr:Hypothetical protein HINF_LOCUS53152 [Hexamita inflata]